MLFDSVDWTTVLQTLIITLPAIIGAILAASIHQQIKTPSGTDIGKQVESTQHVALANHYALRRSHGTNATDVHTREDDAVEREV